LTEAGIPFEFTGWLGIFAPAGAPRDIVIQVQQEMTKAIVTQDMRERWPAGGTNRSGVRRAIRRKIAADLAMYTKVIREAGIPSRNRGVNHRPNASLSTRASRTPAFLIWISTTGTAFA